LSGIVTNFPFTVFGLVLFSRVLAQFVAMVIKIGKETEFSSQKILIKIL